MKEKGHDHRLISIPRFISKSDLLKVSSAGGMGKTTFGCHNPVCHDKINQIVLNSCCVMISTWCPNLIDALDELQDIVNLWLKREAECLPQVLAACF